MASHALQQFLSTYGRECATTVRVLRAFPHAQGDLKPHKMCKTARDLAWIFVIEQGMAERAVTTGFDWSNPTPMPAPPDSLDAIIGAFEQGRDRLSKVLGDMRDDQLTKTVKFFTGPKTIGDVPIMDFLWFTLHDQIHHRGQFSIYLRMADGKVPSIYGPTADEPWM